MYKRGAIILVPFPFTDLAGSKVRPAVIISEGKIGSDIVVVFITSQIKLKGKHLVAITPDHINGLKTPSKIVCSKLATLDAKIILGEIGEIAKSVQEKVDLELRAVLGLGGKN
jgi:mRNA interferase MazF